MKSSERHSTALVPAVAYARMSTAVQNQSIQHQLDSIYAYAAMQGLVIIRTFVDEGRSGLSLANRPGLQALLAAATDAACDFSVIVVYDVSRWGRFQDVDESAFYEYTCRRAGVTIAYCAEQFTDDGAPLHAIMKFIKRAMAAEYSRELSAKVFHAQLRFSRMGYKQGGRPGYGLRRLPVAVDGQARLTLAPGERKPMPTDRVTLSLGLPDEVALVRRIYSWYTEDGWGDSEIARQLRAEGRKTHMGIPWDPGTVRRVLTNERYCGQMLYNQTSRRMRAKATRNPEVEWIRFVDAVEPMVSGECFDRARRIRAARAAGPDPADVLDCLRALYLRHGTINSDLCKDSSLPGRETIKKLFGGYVQAYAAAGIPPLLTAKGALGFRTMRGVVETMLLEVQEKAVRASATVSKTSVWNVLRLNGNLTLKVSIASCRHFPDACQRWRIPMQRGSAADFVLCALMESDNVRIRCYLLLAASISTRDCLFLNERTLGAYVEHCFATMDEVFGLGCGAA